VVRAISSTEPRSPRKTVSLPGIAAARSLGAIALLIALASYGSANTASGQDVSRGAYVAKAAGCISCHTDFERGGPSYGGGRALKTPFGTFYSPNITPDRETGIGAWTDADFLRAVRDGVSPSGEHYFPVFPYTSYTGLTDADVLDIKAFLFSLEPVQREVLAHDVPFPFKLRFGQFFWKLFFFDRGPAPNVAAQSEDWNRGRYLVRAAAHCGECHTPRNFLGGVREGMFLAGTLNGPEGARAPNITPDAQTGIGTWSQSDIVNLLQTGFKPDFDNVQGSMEEVIQHGLKDLSRADLDAIALYLKSIPAVENDVPAR
jgi:mono/diheme cytochrome c family protein